jgi:hypothetical protein
MSNLTFEKFIEILNKVTGGKYWLSTNKSIIIYFSLNLFKFGPKWLQKKHF